MPLSQRLHARAACGAWDPFHFCVIDGVPTAGEVGYEAAALAPEDLVTVQQQARRRMLRSFAGAGNLELAPRFFGRKLEWMN